MASKIFLDANFLIDITLNREGAASANAVTQASIDGHVELYTSPAVLHITAYFTSEFFSSRQTKLIILTLLNNVRVVDCDHATALTALSSSEIDDTEDALQYYTALKHGLDYFISADKKLKKAAIPQLPVYTAAEFLKELKQD
jgi:predicted nucleic acid-binding protein